jgi:hypothetical protein
MPRFYFDLVQDGATSKDEDGLFIGQVEDAELQAAALLAELLFAKASTLFPRTLAVVVKNRKRVPVARVTLALVCERLT